MYRMVKVIGPHGGCSPTCGTCLNHTTIVEIALRDDVDLPICMLGEFTNRVGDFTDDVSRAVIGDRVDRIQPQRVGVEITHPLKSRLDHELPYGRALLAIVVDAIAPRGPMPGTKIRPKFSQVVPFRPQVIEDDVEADR